MSHRPTAALALFLIVLYAACTPCLADSPTSATAASSATSAAPTAAASCPCQNVPSGQAAPADHSFLGRDSLTDHFFGVGNKLSDSGVDVRLAAVQVYQQLLGGGSPGHEHSGLYAGRYDVEMNFGLEKILGLKGGRLYALGEGDWGRGIWPNVGSLTNPNNNYVTTDELYALQLYYEQAFGGPNGDLVTFRVGKINLTACFQCAGCPSAFDGNRYANDETSQFLNYALVNNPTIPFPYPGPGAMALVRPTDWWYLSAAVANARSKLTESSFDSTFNGDNSHFFSVYETGLTPQLPSACGPLPGAYRVGFWNNGQSKQPFDADSDTRVGTLGLYVSIDQKLWNPDQDDAARGPAAFFRFGAAQGVVDAVKTFYSAGLQYQGLVPGRNADVLGLACAVQRLAGDPDLSFSPPGETVVETYYNIQLTPWCHLSPDVQYISNPGGATGAHATIIGLRLQLIF